MKESKIPKFRRCVLQNFPFIEEDFDALTDYELLCKVVEYLNKVIDSQNDVVEKTDDLIAAFAQLKSYVDNYFDNLDVQEEINNKLEEMAEGGELAGIIAQFLEIAPVFGYGTIAEMAASDNLLNGCIARVLGNTSATAGDGAFYSIRTRIESDDPDGVNMVAIGETLVAIRIVDKSINTITSKPINVLFYGVKGDGITDDTAAIQAIIDANDKKAIYFPEGEYLISDTIKIRQAAIDLPDLIFDSKAKLFTNTNIDYLIEYTAEREPSLESFARLMYHKFEGGIFDANNVDVAAIAADSMARDIHFNNVNIIRNRKIGLWLKLNDSFTSGGATVENIYISGMSSTIDGNIGILNDSYDNEFFNIRTCGTQIGIQTSAGGHFTNAHPLFAHTTTPTATEFNKSIGFKNTSNADISTIFIDCYSDGFAIAFDITKSWSRTDLIRCYSNFSVTPMANGDVSFIYLHNPDTIVSCVDCRFDPTDPPAGVNNYVAHNFKIDGDMNLTMYRNLINCVNCRWIAKNYIPDNDISYGMRINKISSVGYVLPYNTPMVANKWYKFALINANQAPQKFRLNLANDGTFDINIKWTGGLSEGSATISKTEIIAPAHTYSLALIDGFTENGLVYSYLAIKTTDSNVTLNPCICDVGSGSNGDIFMASNKYGTDGITTPDRTTASISLN